MLSRTGSPHGLAVEQPRSTQLCAPVPGLFPLVQAEMPASERR
jgi:hypothetical protein